MRDAERIEAQQSDSDEQEREVDDSQGSEQPEIQPNRADRIREWRFQPGKSGNPGGRPKQDMAQLIARAIFENNPELIYNAYTKALKKGSGFTFQVLSDRGYGKLKESLEVSGNISLGERLKAAKERKRAK